MAGENVSDVKKLSVPVVIVEDHNEALYHIYRGIGSKKLPFENGAIVHFDSHPDMVIPEGFDTDRIFDKEYVLSSVSIESWLLPAVYAKHFSTVSWIKPPWATQLSEGRHEFQIGRHIKTNEMKLTCPEAYFVSELAWSPPEELEKVSDVILEVCSLVDFNHEQHDSDHQSTAYTNRSPETLLSSDFLSCLQQTPYVLDIDLDFFSTRNPFLELFTREQFEILSHLYHYEHPSDPSNQDSLRDVTTKRKKQIEALRSQILGVKQSDDFSSIDDPRLVSLLTSVRKGDKSFDLELLHNAGCTCDECDLPHHVSTRNEIGYLMEATKGFLRKLPLPSFITISRSSRNDYCPPEDVEFIQESLLKLLTCLYGPLSVQRDYTEDSKNPEEGGFSKNVV